MRILVVEDDYHFRRYLSRSLVREGYSVKAAGTARDGIRAGARFRPRVLITNWMLGEELDGLQVSQMFALVHASVQTILITGFASSDVQVEMKNVRIFEVVEKPFELARLLSTIERAIEAECSGDAGPELALIELTRVGDIVYANPPAMDLLDEARAGRHASSLAEVFGVNEMPDLDTAANGWIRVKPGATLPVNWWLRSQYPHHADGGRLIVLSNAREMDSAMVELAEILLGSSRSPAERQAPGVLGPGVYPADPPPAEECQQVP